MSITKQTLHTQCPHCANDGEHRVLSKPVSIEFQGRQHHAFEEFVCCSSCGQCFDVVGLEDPLRLVYDAYRQERGFPSVNQIIELRKRLGLDEAKFSTMLNTSMMTVRLYERGALPSEEHGDALSALCRIHGLLPTDQTKPASEHTGGSETTEG